MDAVVERPATRAPGPTSLRDAFSVWGQISLAGIGGAALQLATMHRLLVQAKRWISEDRFFHALSYCIAMPGPETQQLSIYIGWLTNRTFGGVIAGGLFVLPGVVCMMALTFGYVTGGDSPFGHAISLGIRPAILAVMAEGILRFGRHVLHSPSMAVLATASFIAAFIRVPFPIIMTTAGLIGAIAVLSGYRGLARPIPAAKYGPAETAEHRELPEHAEPNLKRFIVTLAFWLVLWLTPPITLLAVFGLHNIFTQISLLFGKVALMAVGGDYAVVAYATEQVVTSYHWLSSREAQEGIAMGEMVPGTIMIVTQFLGSVAAFRHPGELPPLVAGALGGLLATWMTMCPCFLWIMLIAPFLEGLRRNTFLNSTMQAVTAGAVGMILNLSVWFGLRTVFGHIERIHFSYFRFDFPTFATVDFWALVLFLCALLAVFRFKIGTAATLIGSSAVGVALYMLGLAV
jgi:chromate transporter